MSQPYPAQAPEQPVLAPGGRLTLWCAPRGLTGFQLRAALSNTLPAGQRVGVLTVVVLVAGVGGGVAGATDQPGFLALAMGVAFFLAVGLSRWCLTRKRRSHGLVQATPLQFDLLVALAELPADRIDAGRQLHDRLFWLLQQSPRDPAAVRQCEYWMWQLATGS